MAAEVTPEVKAAITKGAIAEFVLLAVGGVLFYFTQEVAWVIGFALAGSAVMMLLLAQAGAFRQRDDGQ
jgi:hypothetical protein